MKKTYTKRQIQEAISYWRKQLAEGKKALAAGKKQLQDGEAQLADGRKQVAQGEKDLAKGYDDYADLTDIGASSGVKAINLLYLYNQAHAGATLTQAEALKSADFIRFASVEMMKVATRLKKVSTLFNVGGKKRFTPMANLKIVLHSDFSANAKAYLYSDTFHEEYVKLPKADEVPYWQGSGDDYDIAETTAIDVKLPSDNTKEVAFDGVIGCMFDEEALGVLNFERYTTSQYNAKAEFTNYWHKQKACQFLDLNENIVVFLCNDTTKD